MHEILIKLHGHVDFTNDPGEKFPKDYRHAHHRFLAAFEGMLRNGQAFGRVVHRDAST